MSAAASPYDASSVAWIVRYLWLIPLLPILASGVGVLLKQPRRKVAAGIAIGAVSVSFLLAVAAFIHVIVHPAREFVNFAWMQYGASWVRLGWVLDPLSAVMLVMVTLVSLLVFIYSIGYMKEDENFTRFFCFLSLFAGAMLGLVISNSLLALFMCWEVVGTTSYLLIGFWYHKPVAAAAAKKAFITTRIGDLGLLLGMVWLYAGSGTLLFYNHGAGAMEPRALAMLLAHTTPLGMTAATGIALLIFSGAVGKSGQIPLHMWLPDAMEGPTPVSALIHAATMVAAGVYLVARVYPLMSDGMAAGGSPTTALEAVAWVGAITALVAALIAIGQNDIKRILAYSTISQLGYMMIGLGVGGVALGLFHLLTHAFFKALLFVGAGSVIHGCAGEQDIRKMGGLRKWMPVTFATYTAGMLALCAFPLFFSGFWSKDAILDAAHVWRSSRGPFYLGSIGALLTAFYMMRQLSYVFFGHLRDEAAEGGAAEHHPHESPRVMTVPLIVFAVFAVLLGFIGTPAWPWLQSFLNMRPSSLDFGRFAENGFFELSAASSILVFIGLGVGWWLYGHKPVLRASEPDVLEQLQPQGFRALGKALYADRFYELAITDPARSFASLMDWVDRWVWSGSQRAVSGLTTAFGWLSELCDRFVVNGGFDGGCDSLVGGGRWFSRVQSGNVQGYLRVMGAGLVVLAIFLLWGTK